MNKYEHSFFIFAKILNLIPVSDDYTKVMYKLLNGKISEIKICNSLLSKASIGDFVDLYVCLNVFNELIVLDVTVYDQPLKLSLCSKCSQAFYNLENHLIYRLDKSKKIKEPCSICGYSNMGYEYLVFEKKEDNDERIK